MIHAHRLRVVAALGFAVALCPQLLAPGSARAARPIAIIQYTAPPGCPDAVSFASLVGDHAGGAWDVRAGQEAPAFLVEIRGGAEGKTGSVRRTGSVDDGAREIKAADCRDLAQALALSTALSLGERAETGAATTSTIVKTGPSPDAASDRSTWMVGGGLLTTFLLPSQPMPEGSLFVESGRRRWRPGLGLHVPDIRLTLSHARNDLLGADRARFTLSSLGLTLCPAGVGFGQTVTVRLCAAGEVGLLSGEGIAIKVPQTSRFLFAAAGAILRLRWAPGRRVVLEAQTGIAAPFEHTTFVFEMPRVEVARVPALVASVGVTAAFAIP